MGPERKPEAIPSRTHKPEAPRPETPKPEAPRPEAHPSGTRRPVVRYGITGALAGAANGFFGAGGGLFLVPLLVSWAKLEQRQAFATSIAVILPLSLVSAFFYWRNGGYDWAVAFPYLIGGALGGCLAGRLFRRVNMDWLRRVFGLLILYGGIRAVLLL